MNRQLKGGVILQYLQMFLSVIIQLIYTPIMLRILGDTEYGIYSLVASIITYLNLFSLGFGASYIRFYSIYKHKKREEDIAKLNGLYLIVFTILGGIAAICGLVLALNVGVFFNETYTDANIETAKMLMLFLSVNIFISFFASTFNSFITAHEKFIFQKVVNLGKTVLSPALNIVLLFMGYGSIGLVVVTTFITLLVDIVNVFYCVKKLNMKFKFRNPNIYLLKDIFMFSIFIAINQIIDQINWQTDKIILGKMINATAVAVYTVGATINAMYLSFSTAISSVFAPRIHRIENQDISEKEKNIQFTDLMIKVGRIQFFVLMLVLTGFIFFGQYFIKEWAGEQYGLAYYITLILIIPVTIPICQNIGIEVQRAKNKHQFRSLIYLAMAIINIGISIWFCFLWGTIGPAWGTAISLILANGILMNIYYYKAMGINVLKFFLSLLKIIPSLIIPTFVGVLIMLFAHFDNLFIFALWIILYTICYCVFVGLFGTNEQEKNIILKPFRRKLYKQDNQKEIVVSSNPENVSKRVNDDNLNGDNDNDEYESY